MLHMERDPAATNMAWKNKKLTNKRENKHIKKEDYFKKLWWLLFLIFSTKFKRITEHQPCDVDNYEKKLLVIPYSPFFPKLTYTQKIPLLLTHSFLIIIPLLQRNDAYWIMYLKKGKKHTKGRLPQSPKNWNNLSVIHSAYYKIITHFNRKLFSPSTYLTLHYKYVLRKH